MDPPLEEVVADVQQRTREDNNTGRAVTGLDILCFGDLDKLNYIKIQ